MITLSGITLPDDLLITPEDFADSGVYSEAERADDGTLHIWEQAQPGSEFDLIGGSDGWIDRSVLSQVYSLATVPNADYMLNYHGTDIPVKFRNTDPPVIEAEPVLAYAPPTTTDKYKNLVIKFRRI